MSSERRTKPAGQFPDDTQLPRFTVQTGGLKDEKPAAPAGVEAVRKAMHLAMRSGDWRLVKELAEAMEQLWAVKAMEVGKRAQQRRT